MKYPRATKRRAAIALAVVFLSSLASTVFGQTPKEAQDPQQPTIKIGTTLVTVPVIVTDRYGRFITGMGRDDFKIREDGTPQKIEHFSDSTEPFNVALLIDTSRSTHNKLGVIRKAALTFIKQLQVNDRVMLVTFDEQVRFISDFTDNRAELERAVRTLKSSYMTSLYDAITRTINEKMNRLQGRKAIVILTDGVDTASKQADFQGALELISTAGIITYAIQYETRNDGAPIMKPLSLPGGPPNSFLPRSSRNFVQTLQKPRPEPEVKEPRQPIINIPRPTVFDSSSESPTSVSMPSTRVNSQPQQPIRDRYLIAADFLRSLAVQSGGLHIRAESIESSSYAFQAIANELRHQYTITYLSNNDQRDGRYRAIGINLNRSDLIIRARLGYRTPKVVESVEQEQEKKPMPSSKP